MLPFKFLCWIFLLICSSVFVVHPDIFVVGLVCSGALLPKSSVKGMSLSSGCKEVCGVQAVTFELYAFSCVCFLEGDKIFFLVWRPFLPLSL